MTARAKFLGAVGVPLLVTATGIIVTGANSLLGFYVNSTTAGTLILYDATSATNAISGTITPALGWNPFPASLINGLFATVGGTLNATFFVTT